MSNLLFAIGLVIVLLNSASVLFTIVLPREPRGFERPSRWANRLAQHPKCRILHSPDPAQSCGIGFLGFAPGVDGGRVRETLWNKYTILTTYMPHEAYSGLRITPNIYSTVRDIDYFSDAVEKELA